MESFVVNGGKKLQGTITVNGSKNAAVGLLAASVVNHGKTTLKNVPNIEEVDRWCEVLESIGMVVEKNSQEKTVVLTRPEKLALEKIDKDAAQKTRSIILLLGSLVGQEEQYSIPQAGGCKLGSRTVRPHLFALENFGIKINTAQTKYVVDAKDFHHAEKAVLYEMGDTVTENAILAAAQTNQKESTIRFASANYMVQDLCFFLQKCGVDVEGIGTSTIKIKGKERIKKDVVYTITEDPIEAMFFVAIAATTNSQITIKGVPINFMELELLRLEKMGFQYTITKEYLSQNKESRLVDITTHKSTLIAPEEKIHPQPYPGINIDNLPFFVPIASVAKGRTLIHDWVYENRAVYYPEVNRLGTKVTLLDPHRAYVEGPQKFTPAHMTCPPALRPAAVILVAMLAAKGESVLRDVYTIKRGYENLEERLEEIGAHIKLIKE
ncbi:MAG: UDP-N-acetylglucosamine 1-carboxyvinyltransferase [Candidatus Moranbacteria bacterium]|nr:UDP-N-acetylglucosamine 1-carboxyvinyltransferase [Candidatus Moranbacteria bacterium]